MNELDPVPEIGCMFSPSFQDAVVYFIKIPNEKSIVRFREKPGQDPLRDPGRMVKSSCHVFCLFFKSRIRDSSPHDLLNFS